MVILTILSIAALSGGAYAFSAIAEERAERQRRADYIRRGYII